MFVDTNKMFTFANIFITYLRANIQKLWKQEK